MVHMVEFAPRTVPPPNRWFRLQRMADHTFFCMSKSERKPLDGTALRDEADGAVTLKVMGRIKVLNIRVRRETGKE